MVYRKRTYPRRKRTYKKKRTMNISRPRMVKSPTVLIKRTFRATNWTPGVAVVSDFWKDVTFRLNQLPSASEITSLFDQYKLAGVKVTFRPRYDSFAGNDTTDTTLPGITNQGGCDIHVIVDPNNDTLPSGTYTSTNLNTFLENGRVRTYSGHKPFSVFCKPKVQKDIQGITGALRTRSWIQSSQTAITHHGFQAFVADPNMTGNFGQSWDLFYTYYLACRGIR